MLDCAIYSFRLRDGPRRLGIRAGGRPGLRDWRLIDRNREVFDFARGMMALRRRHPVLRTEAFYDSDTITWYGPGRATPAWSDPELRSVACRIRGEKGPDLWLAFNAGAVPVTYELPEPAEGLAWHRIVDTFLESPEDLCAPGHETRLDDQGSCIVRPVSSVIVAARR